MEPKTKYDIRLLGRIEKLFIKKPIPRMDDLTTSAIATAASEMFLAMDEIPEIKDNVTKEDIVNQIFDVYNQDVSTFLQLNPNQVKDLIGFSTDFRDYGAARMGYKSQKNEYDLLYRLIELRKQELGLDESPMKR